MSVYGQSEHVLSVFLDVLIGHSKSPQLGESKILFKHKGKDFSHSHKSKFLFHLCTAGPPLFECRIITVKNYCPCCVRVSLLTTQYVCYSKNWYIHLIPCKETVNCVHFCRPDLNIACYGGVNISQVSESHFPAHYKQSSVSSLSSICASVSLMKTWSLKLPSMTKTQIRCACSRLVGTKTDRCIGFSWTKTTMCVFMWRSRMT